jgi:hypothetical protein
MRFLCTEFESNTNNLYGKDPLDQSVISENNRLLTKSNRIDTKEGINYSYLSDTMREILFEQFVYNGTAYTPSAWITAKAITGTDHTGITESFDWHNYSCADIKSSYFYTIIAEDGIHFALPQRISTSKEIITKTIISEFKIYEDDYSFQGESGKMFYIGESNQDTVRPPLIDSNLKSLRINKYKSQQNYIMIQTGTDANPLDYVREKGNIYILISRSEIKTGLYLYTCVLESNTSNSISGIDIANSSILRQILIVNETQAAGTNAGTFTSGADRTRVINTVVLNTIPGASLGSNRITMPIGIYIIRGSAPAVLTILHQAWLYNVGLSAVVSTAIGTSESANYNRGSNRSIIKGYFTVTDTTSSKNVFEIQHRCNTTAATLGLGEAANVGRPEIYTEAEIEKIG